MLSYRKPSWIIPVPTTCGLCLLTGFQRGRVGKVIAQWNNLISTISVLISSLIGVVDSMYSWHNRMRMALHFKPITIIWYNHEKNIKHAQSKKHFAKYLRSIPQNCQGKKTRKVLESVIVQWRLKGHDDSMQWGILDEILEQKKDI